MANIQISALVPVGYDLFNDATSFLDELVTEEVKTVVGGGNYSCYSHHNYHYSHGYSHGSYGGSYRGYW
ncbi:hypothetical protein [Dolichospermum circinale]|uniref:Uncharacterized protein n=1 Tax=Dolichospermum circinale CS-537/01 TaxID=3021739 RepID=A0ABT5A5X5_9CYAN|nr:hypothetical protein [Dolichospermum circinale]MDB9487353.1 hypothetical protein [Dolichospermum circinale CS-537/01]